MLELIAVVKLGRVRGSIRSTFVDNFEPSGERAGASLAWILVFWR